MDTSRIAAVTGHPRRSCGWHGAGRRPWVLIAVGAVTGTVLSLEMGLLAPSAQRP
jgi:hypothetical protein